MHEKAGDFYEKMNVLDRALDSFVQGHAFRKAVELAKRAFPSHVVTLEEEWGDWLASQKQLDLSIEHFVQAGVFNKAIEAALSAKMEPRRPTCFEPKNRSCKTILQENCKTLR